MLTASRLSVLFVLAAVPAFAQTPDRPIAIVGGTLIDGNGGPAIANSVVVVSGERITAVGARGSIEIPADAQIIDATGKFVTPGFIDTNVHLSLYGGNTNARYESLVAYEDRQTDIVLEAAQLQLKYGVTTVRDSYGVLPPLIEVRDAIARGDAVGARMLVAGNIVGWGGPFSLTFSLIPEENLTLFQERMNDLISQGVGEELVDMTPDEIRAAINAYLDKGPDFIKYGGTAHFRRPVLIGFSPAQQLAIVEETHRRGLVAETHATSIEGLRLTIEAGIDLIQHPEILSPRKMPDELAQMIVDRGIVCSMLVNTITGTPWQEHLERQAAATERLAKAGDSKTGHQGEAARREKTAAEMRRERDALELDLDLRRENAKKLIAAGCTVTIGTDNYRNAAPAYARGPKPENQDHGIGTIVGLEGLVELGMTPMQAIVAATRNGAVACKSLDDLGTVEAGKIADLLVLAADPLQDIRNVRELDLVMKAGLLVDRERLPERPVYYREATAGTSR
jgi:imidazolonepropionase-like amidohydrolase